MVMVEQIDLSSCHHKCLFSSWVSIFWKSNPSQRSKKKKEKEKEVEVRSRTGRLQVKPGYCGEKKTKLN